MRLSSTRQAIHDALSWGHLRAASNGLSEHLTYLSKIEKSIVKNDSCGDVLEAAYICAAINCLKPHLVGWVKFAYGTTIGELPVVDRKTGQALPSHSDLTQTALASKLRFDLFPMANAMKHQRWLELSSSSLEDYRLRLRRSRELPKEVYGERMQIDHSNFARDWQPSLDRCLNAIRDWDGESVGKISIMVRSLNGELEDGPTKILHELNNDE